MTPESEANLVQHFRETGDPEAFGQLAALYERRMYAIAASILHQDADAMDSVQDAAIRAFQNIDSLADPARFGGWLMRITFGCSIDRLRSRKSGVTHLPGPAVDPVACPRPRPEDKIDATEWARCIQEAIDSLPTRYRQPLTLFHLDGLSSKQVANHLDIPHGTVRSLLTRARQQLGKILSPELKEIPVMANEIFLEQTSSNGLLSHGTEQRFHIMNGDAAADRLRGSGLGETMVVWTDILHEGPTPIGTSPQEWRRARAEHLSSMGFGEVEPIEKCMREADSALANPNDGRERVFWFEHDLYDQLLLIRHLHWLSQHDMETCKSISLICIGEFPGIDRFIGLGQLESDQIASLLDTRLPIEQEHVRLGSAVWQDFCHADPMKIARWLTQDTSALPYLKPAIHRHLQQYPSRFNGMGKTEQFVLESLQDQPKTAGKLFAESQARETSPFLGDAVVYHYIQRLANESKPAVKLLEPTLKVGATTEIAITDFGLRLLSGNEDRVRTNGINRWFGGVKLIGQEAVWRWDEAGGDLTQE